MACGWHCEVQQPEYCLNYLLGHLWTKKGLVLFFGLHWPLTVHGVNDQQRHFGKISSTGN